MTNMSVNTNEVLTKELGWTTNHKVEKELLSSIKIAYPQFHLMFYFSWALM